MKAAMLYGDNILITVAQRSQTISPFQSKCN